MRNGLTIAAAAVFAAAAGTVGGAWLTASGALGSHSHYAPAIECGCGDVHLLPNATSEPAPIYAPLVIPSPTPLPGH